VHLAHQTVEKRKNDIVVEVEVEVEVEEEEQQS